MRNLFNAATAGIAETNEYPCSSIAYDGALAHMSALLTDRGVSAVGGALAPSAMGGASLAGRLLTG